MRKCPIALEGFLAKWAAGLLELGIQQKLAQFHGACTIDGVGKD